MSLIALCAVFAAVASVASPRFRTVQQADYVVRAATSEPVVLNGAGGRIGSPPRPSEEQAAGGGRRRLARRGRRPVLAAKPLPPKPAIPEIARRPGRSGSNPGRRGDQQDRDGYPNINAPAKEPAGSLLPADERARVIAELEALRRKGTPRQGCRRDPGREESRRRKGRRKCPDGASGAPTPIANPVTIAVASSVITFPRSRRSGAIRSLPTTADHRRSDMGEFHSVRRLPPYVFEQVNRLKASARAAGADIVDLGMGNPDLPTPAHIVEKLVETAASRARIGYSASRGINGLRRAQAALLRAPFRREARPRPAR